MKITQITAHYEQLLPHPTQQYANMRSGMTIVANVAPSDDIGSIYCALMERARILVEQDSERQQAQITAKAEEALRKANGQDDLPF